MARFHIHPYSVVHIGVPAFVGGPPSVTTTDSSSIINQIKRMLSEISANIHQGIA
jgi:hypothetical protein